MEIFNIINRLPFLSQPKGFDVIETTELDQNGRISGKLNISMYKYFRTVDGPPKREPVYHDVDFVINKPEAMRDPDKILFREETELLGLPEMFTDTLPVIYKEVNGFTIGEAANTQFNSNSLLFVFRPRKACFVPVTQQQYLQFWIGKLEIDIEKEKHQLKEAREGLDVLKGQPEMKAALQEMNKMIEAAAKWIVYLTEKKISLDRVLNQLTAIQRERPAVYAIPENIAVMQDRNGKYVETISGGWPYQPDDGSKALSKGNLFTYNPHFFDPKLPPTAIQLLVIDDGTPVDASNDYKTRLTEEFYGRISYKEIELLMYQ
jgi:hypothetical protein